jgi:glutathione S-transferase
VREHVKALLPGDPQAMAKWQAKWNNAGFDAIEAILARGPAAGAFPFGDGPGYFECFLAPQVGNARSAGRSMAPYPIIARIADACDALPAFQRAAPRPA